MKNKLKAERKKYTAQFYQKNHTTFIIALLSTLLTATLNLWIAWIMQQMIDAVSSVPGSLELSVLAWCVASVVIAIIALKGISYYSKPRFMKMAMKQYKDFAFRKLTKRASRHLVLRILQITYLRSLMMPQPLKMAIWKCNLTFWQIALL